MVGGLKRWRWAAAAVAGVLGATAALVVAHGPLSVPAVVETRAAALPAPPAGWNTTRTGGWALEQANQACAFQEPYTLWERARGGGWRPVVRGPSACTPAAGPQARLGPSGYPRALAVGPQGSPCWRCGAQRADTCVWCR